MRSITLDGVQLTSAGRQTIHALDIDIAALVGKRRTFCRTCLDWSERRQHFAGSFGAALLARFEELGWARRVKHSRVITFPASGEQELRAWVSGVAVEAVP